MIQIKIFGNGCTNVDGLIKMAENQRLIHIIFEILAIPAGILLIYIGLNVPMPKWMWIFLVIMGLGNIIIDGYLLTTWFRKKKRK